MKKVSIENITQVKADFSDSVVVLYGAGGNGKRIYDALKHYAIRMDYFCDDDYNKWGKTFCGLKVVSFTDLKEIANNAPTKVLLTSVFSGPILGSLEKLDVDIYEAFSILINNYYKNSFYKIPLKPEEIKDISAKIDSVEDAIHENLTTEILETIKYTICNPNEQDYTRFFPIASKEDCYFIEEVLKALPANPVIIDCGGFTGDLMVALKKHDIDFAKVYSFEVNTELFNEMRKNIERNALESRFFAINKGVWDKEGSSFLDVSPEDIAGGKITENIERGVVIETVTIDRFFNEIPYDFIKMDIEGAERRAIAGGWNTIMTNRPIMAISLYHSIYDVVDIPMKLISGLKNYRFLIRHHSFIDSETVLYCIPEEKWRE